MSNLIKPNMQLGFDVDVALILARGKARYVNPDRQGDSKQAVSAVRQPTLHEAKGIFVRAGARTFVDNSSFPPEIAKQYMTIARCGRVFRLAHHAYDAFIRVREDAYVLAPVLVDRVLVNGGVAVPSCSAWGGFNDKLAVIDGAFGFSFFEIQLRAMLNATLLKTNSSVRIRNPETLLLASMTAAGRPVLQQPRDSIAVITSQISSSGTTCFRPTITTLGSFAPDGEHSCLPHTGYHELLQWMVSGERVC